MALSVGTDLAALLTALPPDAGARRAAAPPATTATALPPDFGNLLASLGEDGTAADPAPASAQLGMTSPAPRPRGGHAALNTEWPWASLAAAAEEATALASQFQRPSGDMAMPAEDAALPEAPSGTEAAASVPLSLPAAMPVPQAAAAVPMLAPGSPASAPAVASLAQPASSPAPELQAPAAGTAAPSGKQVPEQLPIRETARQPMEIPQAISSELPGPAKSYDAPVPGLVDEKLTRAAPATAPKPELISAPPVAAASMASVQQAPGAVMAEGAAVALAADSKVGSLPQRRPGEPRRPAGQEMMASAAVPARAAGSGHPPLLPAEPIGTQNTMAWEEPAGTDAFSVPPSPGRSPPAAELMMRLEPAAEPTPDIAPAALPAPVVPEPRLESPRTATLPNQALPRPHLPPETGQQLALRVVTAAANRVDSVSVDLRPPELGRVELRLTFHDGTVQVSMAAERGDTFEALRQDRMHLEQQMQQAGLQLSSGGLDLQHGHLPRETPEPPQAPPLQAEGHDGAEEEAATPRLPPSDSLIDLIA